MKTTTNSKNKAIIAATLLIALSVGGIAIAADNNCHKSDGCHRSAEKSTKRSERHMQHLANELELSDEQKTQVQAILISNNERMQAQMQNSRQELKTELSAVLTAEQLEKFESMKDRRQHKRRDK